MSYVEENLITGEKVVYRGSLHWIALGAPAVLLGIAALIFFPIGIVTLFGGKDMNGLGIGLLFFLVLCGIPLLIAIVKRRSAELAVTNKRVIIKTGVLSSRSVEMLLSRVESVGVNQGFLGRMLGYGTITLRGTGGTPEPFTRIAHPLEFRRQVQEQIEVKTSGATAG